MLELDLDLEADKMPRRVPMPGLRPSLNICKKTGVARDADSRVVVMPDQSGVAGALIKRLQKLGVTLLKLDPDMDADGLVDH